MGRKLSGRDFIKIGFPQNNTINIALGQVNRYKKKENKNNILEEAKLVLKNPDSYIGDGIWGKVAESMIKQVEVKKHQLNTNRVPFSIYGEDAIDEQTKYQLFTALKLPVAVQGALMPDAHYGYGLPIGGVLATDNAVIPYGVGVDIGCRMSMSVFNLPASFLKGKDHMLLNILSEHTKFGMYDTHKVKADHEVFSREEFKNIPFVKGLLDKAYKQLGTSGSGNHFVEFGIVRLTETKPEWKLEPGEYIAVLSHSGSRGLGANIAKHYTYLATKQCPLPSNAQHLAWLDLNTHDGQEYWLAMNLAGDYAKACHDDIHRRIAKALGKQIAFTIENHHNFAWKEVINNKELIVHRKGATPAAEGQLGIIPGSMTTNGYIVEGLGNAESLNSASHGAGRLYSRAACKQKFTKSEIKKELSSTGVQLIGGSVDEAPMAYKDINAVMQAQSELVKVLGSFTPKFVRMDK
ncbi:RtcB family protein [Myroides odoratimimus]|uniref:RtcB family protein n=1 Tax=Myroides odoratimimus TaxID=76832 RepID=UPI0003537BB2|nr:RtcB family protein [Myroides odoratimimus]EPH11535.1 tRNA-splicing ligase RtcB [Myroides odoratimimus CCUG 12700]MDM1499971.1 RtcB family protein [Myroides odoratimimus]MDM1507538.1 RtcB family protein [Myroides odoratimimus]MDM1514175.1 RtcB family protein [Myroides odoratimimus]MDM1517996.1 RtcB family protein [Myroides odoratimimus]